MTNPAPSIYLMDLSRIYLCESHEQSSRVQTFDYNVYMGDDLPVGAVKVTVFRPEMCDASTLLDAVEDPTTKKVVEAFYADEHGLLGDDLGHCRDLLYVNYIGVEDVFQGTDIGHKIVQTLRVRHGHMHYVLAAGSMWESLDEDMDSLFEYWDQLGFNSGISGTNLLWNNCTFVSEFEGDYPDDDDEGGEDGAWL